MSDWPAEGHDLTGPQLEALCRAWGSDLKDFARHIGIDGRSLRRKGRIGFADDPKAASAIDQMRKEISERRLAS